MKLTNEKVLEVFKPFLDADDTYEVVMTSRGYTLLNGEDGQSEWDQATMCPTPEKLRDALLNGYCRYLTYLVHKDDLARDLTAEEKRRIEETCKAMAERCQLQRETAMEEMKMLTYEKILSVFETYITEDSAYDVVMTKFGYAVIDWEDAHGKCGNAECYPTPKLFLEKMLAAYREYNEYSMLERSGDTERELTPEEEKKLDEMCAAMRAKCR